MNPNDPKYILELLKQTSKVLFEFTHNQRLRNLASHPSLPERINSAGERMVLFFSFDIPNINSHLFGDVFIHGQFFAHEIEPYKINFISFEGAVGPYYKNPGPKTDDVDQRWDRYPKI